MNMSLQTKMSALKEGATRIAPRTNLDWGPGRLSEEVMLELLLKKQN